MSTIERILIFVRHGHYDINSGCLTKIGRTQATITARTLKELSPLELFSSSVPRARETAVLIGKELALEVKMKLFFQEGALPGTVDFENIPQSKRKKAKDDFKKALNFILKPPRRKEIAIIVSHENIIRHLVSEILKAAPNAWKHISIGHASLTTIRINKNGDPVIMGISELKQLPSKLRTRTI